MAVDERTVEVTLNYGGKSCPFRLFDTPLGHRVFKDIMAGATYPLQPYFGEVRTIVDIGANVGAATAFFALCYPAARVLSFEPSPQTYALLAYNTQALANVAVFNVGLADKNARTLLYLGGQDSVTNSVQLSPENTGQSVTIELREAAAALAEQRVTAIDILKLDTEGCEIPILQSLAALVPSLGVLFVEYHDEADRLEIDRLLSATHVLCSGRIHAVHRGELCYIARSRLPRGAGGAQIRKIV
jgi:FkbM family methyltransferase